MSEQVIEAPRALALEDVIDSYEIHAGLRCAQVGDDGDVLILGHHDDAACWAAYEALTGDDEGPVYHDLKRTQVAWSSHSEGCELVDCACERDNVCNGCRAGTHDACEPFCECDADYDHERPETWPCSCECYCDEYAWWVSEVRANGEPATWVQWSFAKASAECCFGTGVEADLDCPIHGIARPTTPEPPPTDPMDDTQEGQTP